jgi:hypothetical protein
LLRAKSFHKKLTEPRIIAYSHVGPSLYRFAQKHKELLRQGPLLIEFWKHCLNQVQFRTIDTEALRAVMEVVKGGKEEWSSVGKSQWGLALNGPFVLDDEKDRNPTPSPTARKVRSSKVAQKEEPSVKKELAEETAKSDEISFGLCKLECNKPWERSDMVRCCGKVRFVFGEQCRLLANSRCHRLARSSGSIARVSKVSGGGHKTGTVLTAKRHSRILSCIKTVLLVLFVFFSFFGLFFWTGVFTTDFIAYVFLSWACV